MTLLLSLSSPTYVPISPLITIVSSPLFYISLALLPSLRQVWYDYRTPASLLRCYHYFSRRRWFRCCSSSLRWQGFVYPLAILLVSFKECTFVTELDLEMRCVASALNCLARQAEPI